MLSRHWDKYQVGTYIADRLFPEQNAPQYELYKKAFIDNEIDGAVLLTLTSDEVKNDLSISILGHRKKILEVITELKNQYPKDGQNHQVINVDDDFEPSTKKRKSSDVIILDDPQAAPRQKRFKTEQDFQKIRDFELAKSLAEELTSKQELRDFELAKSLSQTPKPIQHFQEVTDFELAKSLAPKSCVICLSEVDVDFIYRLNSCGHDSFCRECMTDYLMDQIKSRNPCKCPIPDCRSEVTKDDLEVLLQKETIDLYDQHSLERVISTNPHQFLNCYTPGCEYVFFHDGGQDEHDFLCPKCNKRYCLKCKVEYHNQITCEQYQKWAQENETSDMAFEEYKKKSNGKPCPTCRHFVEKTMGCDHMSCRCGAKFCYKCGHSRPCPCE
ncbi:hypothetical protein AKO1_013547 [Acrasis kona]|uniref:RBR-type E3 ubiquitin transferase n=1 Tax=Acrasis kona TaxID=1008807 RepID=A0AAW2ZGF1_9EUKA